MFYIQIISCHFTKYEILPILNVLGFHFCSVTVLPQLCIAVQYCTINSQRNVTARAVRKPLYQAAQMSVQQFCKCLIFQVAAFNIRYTHRQQPSRISAPFCVANIRYTHRQQPARISAPFCVALICYTHRQQPSRILGPFYVANICYTHRQQPSRISAPFCVANISINLDVEAIPVNICTFRSALRLSVRPNIPVFWFLQQRRFVFVPESCRHFEVQNDPAALWRRHSGVSGFIKICHVPGNMSGTSFSPLRLITVNETKYKIEAGTSRIAHCRPIETSQKHQKGHKNCDVITMRMDSKGI